MGTTGLDQQSLDQAVVLTSHPSESPRPSSGGAWAGSTEVSRPHTLLVVHGRKERSLSFQRFLTFHGGENITYTLAHHPPSDSPFCLPVRFVSHHLGSVLSPLFCLPSEVTTANKGGDIRSACCK
jgi:hypothetical protein